MFSGGRESVLWEQMDKYAVKLTLVTGRESVF